MRNLGHVIIEENLSTEEYEEFNAKLQRLSVDQLRELMASANIEFNKTDNWETDDFIGVLDEAYWDEFDQAFTKITGKSFNDF
ncbi:MAG: hypothetical protein V4702_06295 [Patescibacteria group bacterium]